MSHPSVVTAPTEAGPRRTPSWRVVPARRDHLDHAVRILSGGFVNRAFYRTLLGFDEREFESYWRCFLPYVLRDPAARITVAEIDGEPRGMLALALPGFGHSPSAAAFLVALGLRVSPSAFLRYLGFVRFYERFMKVSTTLVTREARGLWLAVEHRRGDPRLGSFLARETMRQLDRDGISLFTGLVNAGDPAILEFYRRQGFSISVPVVWRGCRVGRVVRCGRHGRTDPCTA